MEYFDNFDLFSVSNMIFYWSPMGFCAFGYLLRTFRNFKKDKLERERVGAYYTPSDTMGTLIGRGLISIIPVANQLAAIFDVGPEVFGKFIKRLEVIFCTPLVPDTEDYKNKRNTK